MAESQKEVIIDLLSIRVPLSKKELDTFKKGDIPWGFGLKVVELLTKRLEDGEPVIENWEEL